ncbi:DUF1772 domain-containing protein [Parapedobacter tibetensis]|uniref:DUF1772 domain-containing protein n=1 Tax=Parapedobacter tibetensis TaxID=2972951 RepID=UPI00214DAFDA|nr:DUF1772 domain-containing protein [Parapedobacter tibetensis]
MNYLEIITIIIVGWVAGAESGSWMCVHPVITKLPPAEQITFQKGLLKTFGRIMPILMPLSLILVISIYVANPIKISLSGTLQLISSIVFSLAIATTIFFNVPVNVATGHWKSDDYSNEWKRKRRIWRFFQGYRSIVFILTFALLVFASQSK